MITFPEPPDTMKLTELLQLSAATADFRAAVRDFLACGRPTERLAFTSGAPRIKVARTLTRLLEAYPGLPIENVRISAQSGCEFFRGEVAVRAGGEERRVRFYWDCKWKALEQGWTDYFGFPDQARAAREFGHDCFREWDEVGNHPLAAAAPAE